MSSRSRTLRAFLGNAVHRALLTLAFWGSGSMLKADPSQPPQDAETNSPVEMNPGLVEPGLLQRGVPSPHPPPETPDLDLQSFYWQTHPFENSALLLPAQNPFFPDDPSSFRSVVAYTPPLGLRPQIYRNGLLEFYPWAGLAQSFDSNVQLTPGGQISDFYTTPRFGLEVQLGTPDSIYNEYYDTLLAAHLSYEGYADLFYEHPGLSAYSQLLNFSSRIGRDRFLLRPFAAFSDITGSNLQLVELQNRVERMITTGGLVAELDVTPVTGWRQTYSVFDFEHRDPAYVNYQTLSTRQELTWLLPGDGLKAILWAGAQSTHPNAGSSGNEYLSGIGWQGQFNPRVHSELWLGWGDLHLNGNVPGRENLSGLRYSGYTSFSYSQRLRFTLNYERAYVFNEQEKNDNYIATLTELKAEIFAGGHWLVIPDLGCSLDNFEMSHSREVELRPELEVSYVFAKENYQIIDRKDQSAGSRIFVKFGYVYIKTVPGGGGLIQGARVSAGFNWNF